MHAGIKLICVKGATGVQSTLWLVLFFMNEHLTRLPLMPLICVDGLG